MDTFAFGVSRLYPVVASQFKLKTRASIILYTTDRLSVICTVAKLHVGHLVVVYTYMYIRVVVIEKVISSILGTSLSERQSIILRPMMYVRVAFETKMYKRF